jgi:glycogen synthase
MTSVERVLMTTDTLGGVWTYAIELSRALGASGVEVALASMGARSSREQRRQLRSLPHVHLFESAYRLEWMQDCWHDVASAGDWLQQIAARVRPDCVHLNGYAHGVLPLGAPVVMVGHSCVLSWFRAVKGQPAPDHYDRYADAAARGLRAARVVVAPTRAMLAALEQHYGPLGDARVIANAVDACNVAHARKQPLVLCAGRLWDEAKNVRALAEVAPRLPWAVMIAGDDQPPPGVSGAGLMPPGAHALGALPRDVLAGWYARAAIYALPARYEPFGLSVLEAALSGCALVLGDIPSLRENWSGAALFVPPGDRAALQAALLQLIAAPEQRHALVRQSLLRARAFAPEKMAAAYLRAYSDAQIVERRELEEKSVCA